MTNFLAIPIAVLAAVGLTACGGDGDNPLPLPKGASELRVAHLSPDAPNVDVWVDGAVVLPNVPFRAVSDYLEVERGSHRIQVSPAGASSPIVIDATLTLSSGSAYTVAATGLLGAGDLQPLPLVDDRNPKSGVAKVRFVHTAPDAPAVDVAVKGGPVLFNNVPFRGSQGYVEVAPGTYDLEVRVAGTSTVALAVPGVSLGSSTNYTIFAVGRLSDGSLAALPAVDAP